MCPTEFITDAVYERNDDPKDTGDKISKKWLSVLLYKAQTEHCQNDLMCSDLLPAQCGNATAVSQDSSPQTLQLLVIMSWLGAVSVKRQHFFFFRWLLQVWVEESYFFKFCSIKVRKSAKKEKSVQR